MKIYEIEENTEVTIVVLHGEKTLNLNSTVVGMKGKDILVAAVRVEGKVLNLSNGDLKVSIMLERDKEKPLIWVDCEVKMIVTRGSVIMRVGHKGDGKDVNRRNNFRVPVGGICKTRVTRSKDVVEMVLRDVSYSGFGLSVDKNYKIEVGTPIRAVYKDESLEMVLDLQGKVVRLEDGKSRKVIGCKLDVPSPTVGRYISEKQQQFLSNRNGRDLGTNK